MKRHQHTAKGFEDASCFVTLEVESRGPKSFPLNPLDLHIGGVGVDLGQAIGRRRLRRPVGPAKHAAAPGAARVSLFPRGQESRNALHGCGRKGSVEKGWRGLSRPFRAAPSPSPSPSPRLGVREEEGEKKAPRGEEKKVRRASASPDVDAATRN